MIRSLFHTEEGEVRRELGREELKAAIEGGKGLLWVHVTGHGVSERAVLSEVFGFHHLAIDDCFNGRVDTPKIDDYGEHLFIVGQSITYQNGTERLDLDEVDIFLGKNYVVSVTEERVEPVEELWGRAGQGGVFMDRGADFLAHTILDSLVDLLLPAVEDMDEALDELEREILADPDKRHLPQLLVLKRNTLRLRRSILPQRDLVNRLSRGEFPGLIRPEALIFYRDVYDHIVRVEEMIEGLRDMADGALSSYLSALNNRMNEVMKTLSIVAVVFLPLTLLASIYGTNLDYSSIGVRFEHGFYLMLGSMVLIAGALVAYFRYRRWF
ncbi:MAG TPA: magnesium/cobalt transporter CorA [Dehalococcoidia bacterium]|nr:magnesium/cobalt transporter CorA [Dehalococcoidia bacterium]